MKVFGVELAKQTIKNAKAAGEYFFERGIRVLGENKGFTESHQIAVDVRKYGGGKKIAERLEEANIIVNKNLLPYDNPNDKENPSGLRIGFQEVTRRGFEKGDIQHLCDLITDVIGGKRESLEVMKDVVALRQSFRGIKYGFQSLEETLKFSRGIINTY